MTLSCFFQRLYISGTMQNIIAYFSNLFINFSSGSDFNLKSAHYCYLPSVSFFFLFKTAVLTKSNLLISCYNFLFFSLTAKVFLIFSILVF